MYRYSLLVKLASYPFFNRYRRLEWTCNKLDHNAMEFAKKFAFSYEGIFRNYGVIKGRNRDLAWFSITIEEWEAL